MKPKRMVILCDDLLELLDMLEGTLYQCSAAQAAEKVYTYMREARELRTIATTETTKRMTKEQVLHVNELIMQVDELVDLWPARKLY